MIDVEDEFHTLREKFDYVLAGSTGGDCPADVRTAPLLARRLLELGVSAIVGIFELKAHDRIRFVRQFLDAMVNAPRELWHPVLVVVDEAHIFCPQHGEAESASAVIDLMTRGRKRGFCGILATQRISKLHKDAAAEANNKLIGRSALDVDMKRAADELGFTSREQQLSLRTLKPGEFFAFGPALSDIITEVRVGDIATTHPRAGHRAAPPAPPRAAIMAALSKLGDLPKQAQEELNTVQALRARVNELERLAKRDHPIIDPGIVAEARLEGATEERLIWQRKRAQWVADLQKIVGNIEPPPSMVDSSRRTVNHAPAPTVTKTHQPAPKLNGANPATNYVWVETLGKAERFILAALVQYPQGRSKVQVALQAGYAHSGGSFSNAIGALRTKGLIEGGNELLRITPAGNEAVGPVAPLPRGVDLLRQWQCQLGKAEREILDALFEVYPQPLSKAEIAERTPSRYEPNGGSFSNAIGWLRTLELIKGRREMVLSEELAG